MNVGGGAPAANDRYEPKGAFMGSLDAPEEAQVALFGAPLDVTTSFRPGTRFGPERIRQISVGLEEYSPELRRELGDVPFYDYGNLALSPGAADRSLETIEEAVDQALGGGRLPLMIGGEHLVTLGALRAAVRHYPDLVVVQLDAHADLRDHYLGERLSHATVMRRAAELMPAEHIYQFGIRSGTRDEWEFGRSRTRFFPGDPAGVIEPLQDVLAELDGKPLYVTVDIDVVDPAFAPGTGTPEPGGVTSSELLHAVRLFSGRRVIGGDLVEVCPPQDVSDATALLGAKVVREALLAWTK